MRQPRVVVIGGGISGLAAAWYLSRSEFARERGARSTQPQVTLLEADAFLGGKIRTTAFADTQLDLGADAFLARHPAGLRLCQELGIENELISPSGLPSYLWSHERLHRLPGRSVMGIPSGLGVIAGSGVVSPLGTARAALDYVMPSFLSSRDADPSVADVVGRRLGKQVLERLVEPLVGGINAGTADRLSLSSTAPQIAELAAGRAGLMRAARQRLRTQKRMGSGLKTPLFHAPPNGMATLIDTLIKQLTNVGTDLLTDTSVAALARTGDGKWEVMTSVGDTHLADAVVIATQANVAAGLLQRLAPEAAHTLATIRYASVAMIRLAYTTPSIGHHLQGSGFLVPATDHKFLTACSFASSKWTQLERPGQVLFRASAGRVTDARAFEMSDEEVIAAAHRDLEAALGAKRRPFAADVTRWIGAFPQYEPGHEARVLKAERALASLPTIGLAGAALYGLGIPSCIKTAQATAERVLSTL